MLENVRMRDDRGSSLYSVLRKPIAKSPPLQHLTLRYKPIEMLGELMASALWAAKDNASVSRQRVFKLPPKVKDNMKHQVTGAFYSEFLIF